MCLPIPSLPAQQPTIKRVEVGRERIAKLKADAKAHADSAKANIEAMILGTNPVAQGNRPASGKQTRNMSHPRGENVSERLPANEHEAKFTAAGGCGTMEDLMSDGRAMADGFAADIGKLRKGHFTQDDLTAAFGYWIGYPSLLEWIACANWPEENKTLARNTWRWPTTRQRMP